MAFDELQQASWHRQRYADSDGWDHLWKVSSPRIKARFENRPSRIQLALDKEVRAEFYLDRIDWPTRETAETLIAAGWAGSDLAELLATARAILAV